MTMSSAPGRWALVTGGSGFIGRRLCVHLRQHGMKVRVAARHPAEGPWDDFLPLDLSTDDLPPAALKHVDTVFHLAAKTHVTRAAPNDPEHWAVTVRGTRRVLEAAQRGGASRFVFMSSVKATGDGGNTLVDEDFDQPPQTAYGRAKREAEEHVLTTARQSGMHPVVLRPPLVYGPGWKGNLWRMFRAVQAGRFPPLPENGNRRSMVHVADVAEAALLAAERPEAEARVYLLADGEAYSTRRVYEAMCHALGRRVPGWQVPLWVLNGAAKAGDVLSAHGRRPVPFDSQALDRLLGSAVYDASRARQELQWTPRHTFEESLPEIVADAGIRASPALA